MTTPTETAIAALEAARSTVMEIANANDDVQGVLLDAIEQIDLATTALRAPVEGDWVCVPREATDEAVDYGAHQIFFYSAGSKNIEDRNLVRQIYAVMTSVGTPITAPPPAAGGMKSAEEWYKEWDRRLKCADSINSSRPSLIELLRDVQQDALATQPEARPLREKP